MRYLLFARAPKHPQPPGTVKKTFVSVAAVLAVAFAASVFGYAQQAASLQASAPPPMSAAQDFTANCSGCHGAGLTGARSPSLFADSLLQARSDKQLAATIREGISDAGMPVFGRQLSDARISQIISYLRIRGGQLRGQPGFNPNPDGQVVKSEKQTSASKLWRPIWRRLGARSFCPMDACW
jgi:mono/diheme cytochrome c family protein